MLAMQPTAPTSIPAEEVLFLGSRCRILATSESTGGKYGLVDMIEVAAGDMPPLHVHHTHDEVSCSSKASSAVPARSRDRASPR